MLTVSGSKFAIKIVAPVGAKGPAAHTIFSFSGRTNFFNSQHGAPEKTSARDMTGQVFSAGQNRENFWKTCSSPVTPGHWCIVQAVLIPSAKLAGPLQLQHQRGLCEGTLIVAYLRAKKTRV